RSATTRSWPASDGSDDEGVHQKHANSSGSLNPAIGLPCASTPALPHRRIDADHGNGNALTARTHQTPYPYRPCTPDDHQTSHTCAASPESQTARTSHSDECSHRPSEKTGQPAQW